MSSSSSSDNFDLFRDVFLLSLCAFLGNIGVSITGFGMAIIYLFIWQILVLGGYDSNFKYAIFIQALALFSAQPLLLRKAEIRQYASRRMLKYFIPITIVSTPIGQVTGDLISTETIEAIGGVLVTFVGCFEIYQKRELFAKWIRWILKEFGIIIPERSNNVKTTTSERNDDGGEQAKEISDNKQLDVDVADNTIRISNENTRTDYDDEIISIGDNDHYHQHLMLYGGGGETSDESRSVTNESNRSFAFNELYQMQGKIGEGRFSIVMEGIHRESAIKYAVKVITKAFADEEQELKLQHEASLLGKLEHPNIVQLHEVYNEIDYYYIVMEKMDGGDLLTRLNGISYFSETHAKPICKMIFGAVQYIASKRIAHRDLKLENLLLLDNTDKDGKDHPVVKISDFGFAKKEVHPNSFRTMCGTPAYVAPEILIGMQYGIQVDMWSLGVIVYMLLAGYQPFRGDDDNDEDDISLRQSIQEAKVEFDEEFWRTNSDEAKDLISSLLSRNPVERITADDALNHPWLSSTTRQTSTSTFGSSEEDITTPVFFMIGSQRSGSNWLRTMLDEREDLVGPHPPHVMREFMPIIGKFGDLRDDDKFRVLVDHVCMFVERNQVPWTDRHGTKAKFPRTLIYRTALHSCDRVLVNREEAENFSSLQSGMYLLSIFDAIMNVYAKLNGKRLWMCKSMGMSRYHDLLLEFYGPQRLRYIYLVRDPRDVAMSFMKTPVGDCHYHTIITKWTDLQKVALRIMAETPELVHKVHYESILVNKETVMKDIYAFIGERRFGGVKRQASVLFMDPTEDLIHRAKYGREASKATPLSRQFRNLHRGDSFVREQLLKWKDPENGLKVDEIELIESVAYEIMLQLNYKPEFVDDFSKATYFSEKDLETFSELNKLAINQMNDDLKAESPEDYERRMYQAEVLELPAVIFDDWDEADADIDTSLRDSMHDCLSISGNSGEETLVVTNVFRSNLCDNRKFCFATASQKGYYPRELQRPNQDSTKSQHEIAGREGKLHWFSVCDGHGPHGDKASIFVADQLYDLFLSNFLEGFHIRTSLAAAHTAAHELVVDNEDIDTSHSGTTATTLLITDNGKKFIVSNVGDSTCILGSHDTSTGKLLGKQLCTEHTPFREDERERIKGAGGLVMSVDQRDGLVPMDENWDNEEAPPRVWSTNDPQSASCGFTRSIGDEVVHTLGVTPQPEIFEFAIEKADRVLIVASDGVTQYLDASTCVEIACQFDDPALAAQALIDESTNQWIDRGDCMDDMTAIVLFIDNDLNGDRQCNGSGVVENHAFDEPFPDPLKSLTKMIKDIEASIYNGDDDVHPDDSKSFNTNKIVTKEKFDDDDDQNDDDIPLGLDAQFWTLFAGAASGFLGGLCGIRGPPLIFYFLHPPYPVSFNKKTQRATGASITATNVCMRIVYYMVDTLVFDEESYFEKRDIILYISIVVLSLLGVLVGSHIFEYIKDAKATIRGILAMFLLLCGISLLISSFANI